MRSVFILLLFICAPVSAAPPSWVSSDEIRVSRLKEGFRIEVDMTAPVSPATAWQVLIDFNGMPRFIPNLESSRIIETAGSKLRVEQSGVAHFGILSHSFQSLREITLDPQREIVAHQISGSAKRMDSVMRLSPGEAATRLEYRAEIVPNFSLPPMIGPAFVRHEMAEQFSAMIQEMVKRNAAPGKP